MRQIVAPYPPAGRIGVASQSGNFVSSFLNLARSTGVGISRAVSAGNAAAVSVADYLDFYADDDATAVGLAYIEGITDGRGLMRRLGRRRGRKPLVLRQGRATEGGARPRPATPERWPPTTRSSTARAGPAASPRRHVDEAFEAAATFATQPLPAGPNTMVLTTAAGGVSSPPTRSPATPTSC